MKALVYDGVEQMGYREVPDATPRDGEHLIRVTAVGICGSDMHAYLGHDDRRPAPLILGHEAAGVIVGGPRDSDRVTVNPLVTCGTCQACTSGRENLCTNAPNHLNAAARGGLCTADFDARAKPCHRARGCPPRQGRTGRTSGGQLACGAIGA